MRARATELLARPVQLSGAIPTAALVRRSSGQVGVRRGWLATLPGADRLRARDGDAAPPPWMRAGRRRDRRGRPEACSANAEPAAGRPRADGLAVAARPSRASWCARDGCEPTGAPPFLGVGTRGSTSSVETAHVRIRCAPRRTPALTVAARALRLGRRPVRMGIVNATPDSFSDAASSADPGRRASDARRRCSRAGRGDHRRRRRSRR